MYKRQLLQCGRVTAKFSIGAVVGQRAQSAAESDTDSAGVALPRMACLLYTSKADYDTWAYGISAEYGYRQDLNAGWFVEPQAELSLGHIGSCLLYTSVPQDTQYSLSTCA